MQQMCDFQILRGCEGYNHFLQDTFQARFEFSSENKRRYIQQGIKTKDNKDYQLRSNVFLTYMPTIKILVDVFHLDSPREGVLILLLLLLTFCDTVHRVTK